MRAKRTYGNGLSLDKWGNYVVRFRVAGRGSPEIRKNLGKILYADAVTQAAIEKGKVKARSTAADPRLTFSKLAESYVASEGGRLSERGRALMETILRCHLKPFFGEMRVDSIRAVHVEAYRKGRRALVGKKEPKPSERPISPATFAREYGLLRAVLNYGERSELIEKNPIRRGSVKLKPTAPRTAYFEPEEWKAFLEAAEAHADTEIRQTVPFWRALLLTYSRIGEIVELRWRGVDFTGRVVRISQGKTANEKAVSMGDDLEKILRPLARFRKVEPDAPVFLKPDGEPWTIQELQTAFRRIARRVGLDSGAHGRLTPHSIRHTGATWALRAGVSIDRIAAVLGHADDRMTRRTYAHIRPDDLAPAADALGRMEAAARLG